jgi:hypothetical protein
MYATFNISKLSEQIVTKGAQFLSNRMNKSWEKVKYFYLRLSSQSNRQTNSLSAMHLFVIKFDQSLVFIFNLFLVIN